MQSATDHSATNEATIRRFMIEVWDAGEPARLSDYLSDQYVDESYNPPNRSGLEKMILTLSQAFPDQRTVIEECVAAGDSVVIKARIVGTHRGPFRNHPATDSPIDVKVVRWFEVKDRRITRHWAMLDNVTLYKQIGLPPA